MTTQHTDPETWEFECDECSHKSPTQHFQNPHVREFHINRDVELDENRVNWQAHRTGVCYNTEGKHDQYGYTCMWYEGCPWVGQTPYVYKSSAHPMCNSCHLVFPSAQGRDKLAGDLRAALRTFHQRHESQCPRRADPLPDLARNRMEIPPMATAETFGGEHNIPAMIRKLFIGTADHDRAKRNREAAEARAAARAAASSSPPAPIRRPLSSLGLQPPVKKIKGMESWLKKE